MVSLAIPTTKPYSYAFYSSTFSFKFQTARFGAYQSDPQLFADDEGNRACDGLNPSDPGTKTDDLVVLSYTILTPHIVRTHLLSALLKNLIDYLSRFPAKMCDWTEGGVRTICGVVIVGTNKAQVGACFYSFVSYSSVHFFT